MILCRQQAVIASKKKVLILSTHFFLFFLSISSNNRETSHKESSRSSTPSTQQLTIPNQYPAANINHNHVNNRSKRYSTPLYSDYGCNKVNMRPDNGKISKRSIRSMNETVEVLADQVEEDTYVSTTKLIVIFGWNWNSILIV